jgi:hypothetical protein
MKLNKTMLVTLLAGMALCGCQKDDDASSNENGGTGVKGTPLIATMTLHNEDGVTARSFRYDEKGRLVGEVDKRNSADYYSSTISYEAYKYIWTSVFVESGNKMERTGTLNEKGLVTSVTHICSIDRDSGTEILEYNSEGYCIHCLLTYKDGIKNENTYTFSGGNLVEGKESFQHNFYDWKYTYYTDRVNTIGVENLGVSFMGKQSKNLIKSETKKETGKEVTYTYEFDSKNRVTKQLCSDGSYTEYTYVK